MSENEENKPSRTSKPPSQAQRPSNPENTFPEESEAWKREQPGYDTPSVREELRGEAQATSEAAAERAGQTVSEYGQRAHETLEAGRQRAAEGLDRGAKLVRERSQETSRLSSEQGTKVADSMEEAAKYLRQHTTDEIRANFEDYVRQHPTQSLAGAVLAGFVLGRVLR